MSTTDDTGWQPTPALQVLTPVIIQQIDEKLVEVSQYPYAEVILILKRGALRFIRSGKSEPIRTE